MESKIELEQRNANDEKFENCKAFCPECGSDLYFAKDGCYCKASFKKSSGCEWACANCQPRNSIYK